MFQMGGVGPMFGQAHHFMRAKKDEIPYGTERYGNEAKRLYGVMDKHLASHKHFADEYTIADMATVPWLRFPERQGVNIDEYPALKRWRDAILERPAVKRALEVLKDARRAGEMSKEQKENLFGAKQYEKR